MSRSTGIYFMAESVCPAIEKIWDFIRTGELIADFGVYDSLSPAASYTRSGWIYPNGVGPDNHFEFSDLMEDKGFFPKYKIFASFATSNAVFEYNGKRYTYNYEAMEELMEYLKGEDLSQVTAVCFYEESITKPKALNLWTGPKLLKL